MSTYAPTDDAKPNTEEKYGAATHASNLRVEADRGGSADMLIAAGWSASRLGAGLIRLHSEWEGAARPKRQTKAQVEALAQSMERLVVGERKVMVKQPAGGAIDSLPKMVPNLVLDMAGATKTAHDWYIHDMKLVFQQLKMLPEVRQQLVLWAMKCDMAEPAKRTAEVVSWWLDHRCPACDGRGKDTIPGTPSLSHKDCKACHGTGETRIPAQYDDRNYLHESKKMLRYINDCVNRAQSSIRSRLQPMRPKIEQKKQV